MLREIYSTHRINHRKPKRWFRDANMDLFVWFKNQRPVCFQLSYNKCQLEHSISWHTDTGFSHSLVKPENRHAKYRILPTPSSEYKCDFNPISTARDFLQASNCIEASLADFIFARLIEYPGKFEIHSNQALVSGNL